MLSISAVCQSASKLISRPLYQNAARSFSACSFAARPCACQTSWPTYGVPQLLSPTTFLTPASVLVVPSAGMKQKGKLRRRCKSCQFVMIDERLHIWCDAHPRHKQQQMIPKPKTVIITTHATQGKIRPW